MVFLRVPFVFAPHLAPYGSSDYSIQSALVMIRG